MLLLPFAVCVGRKPFRLCHGDGIGCFGFRTLGGEFGVGLDIRSAGDVCWCWCFALEGVMLVWFVLVVVFALFAVSPIAFGVPVTKIDTTAPVKRPP